MNRFRKGNLSIPKNCSVVDFDNIAISAYMVPPLTTFEQPKYELGYAAARMMMNLLTHEIRENQTAKSEVLRGTLIIRESTAPPKASVYRLSTGLLRLSHACSACVSKLFELL